MDLYLLTSRTHSPIYILLLTNLCTFSKSHLLPAKQYNFRKLKNTRNFLPLNLQERISVHSPEGRNPSSQQLICSRGIKDEPLNHVLNSPGVQRDGAEVELWWINATRGDMKVGREDVVK